MNLFLLNNFILVRIRTVKSLEHLNCFLTIENYHLVTSDNDVIFLNLPLITACVKLIEGFLNL